MKQIVSMSALLGLFLAGVIEARAGQLIINGGFETGSLAGWTETNQAGGSGSWYTSSSTYSPLNSFATPGPASGSFYALTDQTGAGSHALTESFTVAAGSTVILSFNMFSDNRSGVQAAVGGANDLSYAAGLNEHARVDILTAGASAFDTSSGVVANLYNGSTLTTGATNPWVAYSFDITAAVGRGGTFQLRFVEVDDAGYFEQGVDNVSILATTSVPEPGGFTLLVVGIVGTVGYHARWRRRLGLNPR